MHIWNSSLTGHLILYFIWQSYKLNVQDNIGEVMERNKNDVLHRKEWLDYTTETRMNLVCVRMRHKDKDCVLFAAMSPTPKIVPYYYICRLSVIIFWINKWICTMNKTKSFGTNVACYNLVDKYQISVRLENLAKRFGLSAFLYSFIS